MPVHADREIKINRPDIVVKRKDDKRCLLIAVSIPADKNTSVKVCRETVKIYKDLEIEIERMWGMKTTVVPVVIGALGIIKEGKEQFIEKNPKAHQTTRASESDTAWYCTHPSESACCEVELQYPRTMEWTRLCKGS